MITRSRMITDAESLLIDAENRKAAVAEFEPDRLPLAQAILNEATHVLLLCLSSRLCLKDRQEIVASLRRARDLSDALQRPIQ